VAPIAYIASYYPDPEACSNVFKGIVVGYKIHASACKEVGATASVMMFIPITTVLTSAMADKSGGTVCTVGFNCLEPLSNATQVPGIAEIQK
jgi:hypothetical protein